MKKYIFIMAVLMMGTSIFAQKFVTKSGHIRFYSETPMETIEADNKQVNSAYDHENGAFVFKVLMKSFEFEKALMQEHFNENYVESDDFPNAFFKGKIVNNEDVDLEKMGELPVKVKGKLTIHGMTMDVEADGMMNVQKDMISATSKIMIEPKEYDIKIPGAVVKNIAEEIEVFINVDLKKL
ncbi:MULTISPECIES: YceI family protein [unclassified Lentimicrobium]|uniref:YceI family protein n=1 Tax=unclassified Lentimicrobium TaxID=2677434 RepID=UPI001556500A|nr:MULTISPECIES: YceI family protein [unclassified Lentimicrobium]NPD45448.1 YceI family protein [Lentimicrobium sp. S6]NPD86851.1 YceI family protein [Lentimicrobium sp. L6]